MFTATCEIDLQITNRPNSLKEKRMVIRSLKEKIKNRFGVSIAEVGSLDLWQRASLGIACVSAEKSEAEKVIDQVIHFIDNHPELEIVALDKQFY